jgi:hypothetical protein
MALSANWFELQLTSRQRPVKWLVNSVHDIPAAIENDHPFQQLET